MDDVVLPLFPLNVVLFPGSALPLHIFEERYRQLVRECLEDRWREFGINFVDTNALSTIGCTAAVTEVVQRYEDGRLDIIVAGRRRYELHDVEEESAPYFLGHGAFLVDEPGEVDRTLAEETIGLYNIFLAVVYKGRLPGLSSAHKGSDMSFVMAQKAGMPLQKRQKLLELRSENLRLRLLREHFTLEMPKLKEATEVQRIVHNDGYIFP